MELEVARGWTSRHPRLEQTSSRGVRERRTVKLIARKFGQGLVAESELLHIVSPSAPLFAICGVIIAMVHGPPYA
jgi:hypothetical protein